MIESRYILQPANKLNSNSANITHYTTQKSYNGRNVTAYYAKIENPIKHFKIFYADSYNNGTCSGYAKTSTLARQYNCLYATNAGPFTMHLQNNSTDTCQGYIVSNESVVLLDSTSSINFGLTSDGSFIMGSLTTTEVTQLNITELVTGFGWLLMKGINQVNPGGEIAPRTAIGTDIDGNLYIFEADGAEDMLIGNPKGLTLQQTSEWLSDLGIYNAVNLDGGGSSVTVINGNVVSKPTCKDYNFKCERRITTITCIV